MPDIPNRTSLETRTADALKRLRGEQRARLVRYLGKPPDPRKVPESFWREIEEEDRSALMLLLLPVAIAGAQRTAKLLGLKLPDAVAEALVTPQVSARASQVAADAVKNSQSRWQDLIQSAGADDPELRVEGAGLASMEEEIEKAMQALFGDGRAESTAITETTQANGLGELETIAKAREGELPEEDEPEPGEAGEGQQRTPEDRKRQVEILWHTMEDSGVCPVCRPLNGEPEEVWSKTYYNGPPGHPNCRCWLEVSGGAADGRQFRAN